MKGKIRYNIAEEETYNDGQIIFKETSPGDWVYVILSGSVEILKNVQDRKVIIEKLQPGEVFGELGFIGGIKRTATARAIGETTLGIIDRGFLEKEYNQLSGQFRSILEIIVLRFKKMLDRTCDITRRTDQRYPKVLSLVYKDRQAFVQAYTENASAGGFFIKTEKPLIPGHRFLLKLELSGIPGPLQIKCDVIWAREQDENRPAQEPGMGVKFREISKKDYQLLKKYIAAGEQEG